MNDYQLMREKSYVLPQTVYRQALYAVKDLERLRRKLSFLKEDAGSVRSRDPKTMMSEGGFVSDLTGDRASEIVNTEAKIKAIEEAMKKVPEKYRHGLEERLVNDVPYSNFGYSINTWKKWQQIFIYHVAVNLGLL